MALTGHKLGCLVETDITEGDCRVTIHQQWINLFTFLQSGNRTILPVNRADIGSDTKQCIVSAHQSFVAQIQTLIEQAPELLFITLCQNTDLWEVQGYNALVETAFPFIISVLILPRGEERTASHTGEYIAFVVLTHLLRRDIIRIQTLRRAFHRKLSNVIILAAL